jgi:hypothetical protein
MLEPHIAPPACVTEDAFAALIEISKRPPVVFVEARGFGRRPVETIPLLLRKIAVLP